MMFNNEIGYVYDLYVDGEITAEQALKVIAVDAGIVTRTKEQEALGDLVREVSDGALPVSALIGALET